MGRTTIIVLSASLLAAVFAWVLWPGAKNQAPAGRNGCMQTVSVGVSSARRTDIHAAFYALGAVTPLTTVTVKPQVNGILRRIAAPSGAGDAGRSRHAERLSVHPDPEWLFAHGTAEMFGKITADQKKFR
jgi:hypothetical protein